MCQFRHRAFSVLSPRQIEIIEFGAVKARCLGPVQTSCFCCAELNSIRFDCSTAEVRLWFRRCARVVPNSGFTTLKPHDNYSAASNQTKLARFSKLNQKLLLVKLLQNSRKQRKERQWKILFLLQLKGKCCYCNFFPDSVTPVFFRELQCCSILSTSATKQLQMVWTCGEYIQWC